MNPAQSQPPSLHQVVEHDETMIARFPPLAVSIHTEVTRGEPFEQPRADLLDALAKGLVVHAAFDKTAQDTSRDDPAVGMLTAALAAQHRSLAARVEELAQATTGLDAVASTRTIHAILNLTLDLERRILEVSRIGLSRVGSGHAGIPAVMGSVGLPDPNRALAGSRGSGRVGGVDRDHG